MTYEEEILNQIDNGINLSERDIRKLVWDYEIDREEGDCGRWTRHIHSIISINDRTFCIEWEQGLTEMQENEFYNQPYEVEKVTYEKTITVTEWKPIVNPREVAENFN